jgi:hypothetical protein
VKPNQQCQPEDQHGDWNPELNVRQYSLRDVRFWQAGVSPGLSVTGDGSATLSGWRIRCQQWASAQKARFKPPDRQKTLKLMQLSRKPASTVPLPKE